MNTALNKSRDSFGSSVQSSFVENNNNQDEMMFASGENSIIEIDI